MTGTFTEQRITSLEISMADLKEIVAETSRQMAINSLAMGKSLEGMRHDTKVFKEEVRADTNAFKEDMRRLGERMNALMEKMDSDSKAFKDDMRNDRRIFDERMGAVMEKTDSDTRAFKEDMRRLGERMNALMEKMDSDTRAFKEDMRRLGESMDKHLANADKETRRHNQEMGRIANKYGTMVEDLVGPSIGRILKEALGIDEETPCEEQVRVIRPYRGDRTRRREFDAIAECLDYVLINETRSTLRTKDIDEFLKTMSSVRDYFPEFADRKLIGAVASLRMEEGIVNYATKKGLLALAVGIELMDVQNPPGFRPTIW